MASFWFLAAVALLIIWLVDRSSLKKANTERYNRGWWDGYGHLKDKILALGKIDAAAVRNVDAEVLKSAGIDPANNEADNPEAQEALYQQNVATQTSYDAPNYYSPQPQLTAEESAAAKERRTLQNLNTLLYVGSFLIVAAAALFVTLATPPAVKLACLVLVTVAFYVAGLVLHAKSTRLKPAALAFVGTGLAILPFVGFALTSLGGFSGQSAWLVVSVVGLVAYAVAAVRLQSQLVSYLTMAFVLSLALSAVATLGLSILWYFIVTLGVSVVCNSIHYLWPKLLPSLFWQPVAQTGKYTTPIALAASLVAIGSMELFMYVVLFGVATTHYMVVWLERRIKVYELAVRALAHAAGFMAIWYWVGDELADSRTVLLLAWIILAILQILYSLVRVHTANKRNRVIETTVMAAMLTCILLVLPWWATVNYTAEWTASTIATMGVLMAIIALRLRQVGWLYGVIAATVVLPFILLRWIALPAVSYEIIALIFAAMGALALVNLEQVRAANRSQALQILATSATFIYTGLLVVCGALAAESAALGWTALVAAWLLVLVSYVLRSVVIEVVAAALLVMAVAAGTDVIGLGADWQLLVTVVASTVVAGVAAFAHHINGERTRRDAMAIVAALLFVGIVFTASTGNVAVVTAATVLLLVASIKALAIRILTPAHTGTLSNLALCAYATYPVLAIAVALQAGGGWPVLAAIVLAKVLWISSYIEKQPAVFAIGHTVFYVSLHLLWSWLGFDENWRVLGTLWIAAGVWYLMYWYNYSQQDSVRQSVSFIGVQLALVVGAAAYLFSGDQSLVSASAGSLLMAAGVLAVHGAFVKNRLYTEVAIYAATFSVQRIVSLLLPELNIVAYGHWWAVTIALVAVWRKQLHTRLIVALALVTGSTGIYALIGVSGYSFLFLIEHLLVLVAGALLRKQWAMWWGIIAVVVAVLYFLRNYTSLALLFLGFLLILFVIWRLLKVGKK